MDSEHVFHAWEESRHNSIGLAIEFQCSVCLERWGWTGAEWGYLEAPDGQ